MTIYSPTRGMNGEGDRVCDVQEENGSGNTHAVTVQNTFTDPSPLAEAKTLRDGQEHKLLTWEIGNVK